MGMKMLLGFVVLGFMSSAFAGTCSKDSIVDCKTEKECVAVKNGDVQVAEFKDGKCMAKTTSESTTLKDCTLANDSVGAKPAGGPDAAGDNKPDGGMKK
jgi:hypothetical protein